MVEAGKDLCGISLVRMLIQEISFMMSPPSWPTHRPEDYILRSYHCCSSVTKLCPALCDPMDCSMPGFPVLHYPQSLLKLMSIESVMLSNHFILCHPLLLLTSIFPSIRVFSKRGTNLPIWLVGSWGSESCWGSADTPRARVWMHIPPSVGCHVNVHVIKLKLFISRLLHTSSGISPGFGQGV